MFITSGKSCAEAASHEAGHTLGLGHDGANGTQTEYYGGQGSGNTGWAPIMGVGYDQTVTQWSKGEYANANNTQDDLAIISYGAYVHVALRAAATLAAEGIQASVLDLRTLSPLDRPAVLAVARHCSRVLIVHEDTRTGSIGESLAAFIQEQAFESLDAPVRIVGSLDTPVPYSPPLEEYFLPSQQEIERAARLLIAY